MASFDLCLDPKPLNEALQRGTYRMPTLDDVLPELSNAKLFSVADVKNGFWHVELDDESKELTTFGTPFGRFCFKRMPFGLKVAPEIFQQRLHAALTGLRGIYAIADDILIVGEGDTDAEAEIDHDRKLETLLKVCRTKQICLNRDKLRLKMRNVTYMGHQLTDTGLKPDPQKIQAILAIEKPSDVAGVRRLLGMVNYLAKFTPRLSDMCEPFRQLTKKDTTWLWTENHDQALTDVKHAITKAPILRYFDDDIDVVLQCDASQIGLGAVILQNQQPIGYASRTLTDTERRYAQIENELLAIQFGLQRFDHYTYGRLVTVHTDHKPLVMIYKKALHATPKRLQRMLLGLQRYDLQLEYIRGSEMYIADTLSRAAMPLTEAHSESGEQILSFDDAVDYLPMREESIQKLRQATCSDQTLQSLKETIQQGWPTERSQVDASIRQ